MFDPEEQVPYTKIGTEVICCDEHRALAREAAEKSIVLLKNRGGILPLNKDSGNYYITGPNAADVNMLLGNYCGLNDKLVTPLEGIIGAAGPGVTFNYRKGVLLNRPNPNPVEWAVSEAKHADAVIAVMGLSPDLEGEEGDAIDSTEKGDRESIMLPDNQLEYLRKLHHTGTPVILVLGGGSPIALGDVAELVDAVLFVWIPGEEGGKALGNVIFGNTSPSGKLPITFPRSTQDLPPYEDYAMEGRTYKFIKSEPLFPFGFGLSYTTFAYDEISLSSAKIETGSSLNCSVKVSNTGSRKAEEAVQIYISDLEASTRVPQSRLCGFRRIALPPGQSERVTFRVSPEMMCIVDEDGNEFIEAGRFRLSVGGSSPGTRSRELGASEPAVIEFEVTPPR
jgi:beta-glucosidase